MNNPALRPEAPSSEPPTIPSSASADALAARIARVLALLSETNVALLVGKSVKQLHRYAQGKSEPPVTAVAALAAAARVRLEWLATGRGPMREEPGAPPSQPAFAQVQTDARLLSRLAERILAIHREAGLRIELREAVERAAREHDGIVAALADPDDRLLRAGEVIAELRHALLSAGQGAASADAGRSAGEQERGPAQRPAVDQGEPSGDQDHSGHLTGLE